MDQQRPIPHMSAEEFRRLGREAVDLIAEYLETVEGRPVGSTVAPGEVAAMLPMGPPSEGEAWEAILGDVERVVVPGLTHWQSPNFHAYFPANSSYPAILGDLIATGLGVNGMLWATSPAATEVETRVLDWLGGMIGLPAEFLSASPNGGGGGGGGGVIQGTASEATLVSMVAGRHRKQQRGNAANGRIEPGRMTLYASAQAHSSIVKAAMIAGFADGPDDRRCLRLIGTDRGFAMRPDLLERAIREDVAAGRVPIWACATVGTTSSTANDPLGPIGRVCREHGVWLHVDAAMTGAAFVCPEHRGPLAGVELADSFCFNPHKWLLTTFDCDCLWTRDRASLTGALSVTPEYLRNAASDAGRTIDYRDWQIPLGRRFRALKLWFVIRHYGVEGLRAYIREHLRLAALFEGLVRADDRFEVAAPRTITLICFRLMGRGDAADARNRELLRRINAGGAGGAYLSHTVLPLEGDAEPPSYVLRMAIGSARTEERHVRAAWGQIARAAAEVCSDP